MNVFLLYISELYITCLDRALNISIGQTVSITSPLYPVIPRSEFAYQCTWILDRVDGLAHMIEIIHFEGPDWLNFEIVTYDYVKNEHYYFLLNSQTSPKSITIGIRRLKLTLREVSLLPARSNKHVFSANITGLPFNKQCNNMLCLFKMLIC